MSREPHHPTERFLACRPGAEAAMAQDASSRLALPGMRRKLLSLGLMLLGGPVLVLADDDKREEDSSRPQVKPPALLAPANSPKLRPIGGVSPKVKPAEPKASLTPSPAKPAPVKSVLLKPVEAPEVAPTPAPKNEAADKETLKEPAGEPNEQSQKEPAQVDAEPQPAPEPEAAAKSVESRSIRNPFAIRASDDGRAKSQNEPAHLPDDGKPPAADPETLVTPPGGAEGEPEEGVADEKPTGLSDEKSILKNAPQLAPPPETAPEAPVKKPVRATVQDMSGDDEIDEEPALPEDGGLDPQAVAPRPLPASAARLDHHPANLHGVTPGVTDEAALKEALGEPLSDSTENGKRVLMFNSETFKDVDVIMVKNVVDSITLTLPKPLPVKQIEGELGLSDFLPGTVNGPEGDVLGQVYPERGVVLHFASGRGATAQVDQIILNRVEGEPFLLRALDDQSQRYAAQLSDVETALSLDAREPRALWLKANLLSETGRHLSALRLIDEAIGLDAAPGYRLSKAKILLELGQYAEASRLVSSVLEQNDLPPQARARGLCLVGEIISSGSNPEYAQAIETYQASLKEATALAQDDRAAVRRFGRRLEIECHLGIARCVAYGNGADAARMSAQWLDRARLLADSAVKADDVSNDIWLLVHRAAMASHVGLSAKTDASRDIASLLSDSKRLLARANDDVYRPRVAWELSLALADASRVEFARGNHRAAAQYADSAWNLMQTGIRNREPGPADEFARGMLLYHLGTIAAVARNNHQQAVQWYEQAYPLLEKPLPESIENQNTARGLAIVGMGASYWEIGDRKQAIALSEAGARTLHEAVSMGKATRDSLTLAYGNLESMYRQMGDNTSAERVAKLSTTNVEKTTIIR